jgi:hypothetical protein
MLKARLLTLDARHIYNLQGSSVAELPRRSAGANVGIRTMEIGPPSRSSAAARSIFD